jgi:hypothetical protein
MTVKALRLHANTLNTGKKLCYLGLAPLLACVLWCLRCAGVSMRLKDHAVAQDDYRYAYRVDRRCVVHIRVFESAETVRSLPRKEIKAHKLLKTARESLTRSVRQRHGGVIYKTSTGSFGSHIAGGENFAKTLRVTLAGNILMNEESALQRLKRNASTSRVTDDDFFVTTKVRLLPNPESSAGPSEITTSDAREDGDSTSSPKGVSKTSQGYTRCRVCSQNSLPYCLCEATYLVKVRP